MAQGKRTEADIERLVEAILCEPTGERRDPERATAAFERLHAVDPETAKAVVLKLMEKLLLPWPEAKRHKFLRELLEQ